MNGKAGNAVAGPSARGPPRKRWLPPDEEFAADEEWFPVSRRNPLGVSRDPPAATIASGIRGFLHD